MTQHRRRGRRQAGRGASRTHGPRREHIDELHPVDEPPEVASFAEWALGDEVQNAIRLMDITVPTPIQALSIGSVLAGRDVIAKAETGTGKTLAFGAPLIARIDPARSTVLALILCPTRELASQVCDVITALAFPRGIRVALVVGGDPMHPQIAALQAGAQVVVGTPGRVLDLYQQRFLSFPWAEACILDEADKMFEIGFLDDIKKILSYFPEERQTLLFSATFPTEVLKLARSETKDPVEIATRLGTATVSAIDQRYIEVDEADRVLLLTRLFERSLDKDVFLVFCDRRTDVDRLLRRLERLPFSIKALHGGYDQAARFRVMSAFRSGEVKALIATDVASRGLDVEHVSHVINFNVPRDVEDYTHRIGRTGRAGRSGKALTFVVPADGRRWRQLVGTSKYKIEELEMPGRTSRAPARERDQREDRSRGRRSERSEKRADRSRDGEPARKRERGDSRSRSDAGARERKPATREATKSRQEAPAFGSIAEPAQTAEPPKEREPRAKRRSRADEAPKDSTSSGNSRIAKPDLGAQFGAGL